MGKRRADEYGPCHCPGNEDGRPCQCPEPVGEVARLQSAIAGCRDLVVLDCACVIERVHRFEVGTPSYTVAFRRSDGRLHRLYCTGSEVGRE